MFQVVRDYAHTLAEGASRHLTPAAAARLAEAEALEAAVGPVDIVFGHNDLLPANILDDGHRLWLVDWDYAGFNSPLFDLGGLASNAQMPQARRRSACSELYFDRPVTDALRRAGGRHDRRLAAARDDVEHGVGAPFDPRLRLCRLHAPKTSPATTRRCARFRDMDP